MRGLNRDQTVKIARLTDCKYVINTAGRPKCCRKRFEYKIHHLSHITYRIKRIKIFFCILSTHLITIA